MEPLGLPPQKSLRRRKAFTRVCHKGGHGGTRDRKETGKKEKSDIETALFAQVAAGAERCSKMAERGKKNKGSGAPAASSSSSPLIMVLRLLPLPQQPQQRSSSNGGSPIIMAKVGKMLCEHLDCSPRVSEAQAHGNS